MTNSDRLSASPAGAPQYEAKCEKCGAATRLNSGVCMSCLLRAALEGEGEVSKALYENVLDELDARDKPWFLGNYEILEQIGCGGMGVIYRARQRHSQRIVAVKRVLSYRADSHGALERFRREARAVASLDHPNILPIYEVNESQDGLPFFSMKFAEKGSLHENLASLRDAPRKSVQLMAKVARAVEHAHSCGVLHRDIKPGNILLNDRGEPLVSDFGLAKLLDGNNDLTRSLTTFGTAGFIAPEQAGHAAVDFTPVGDVYSLGAVLFNLLAGRPPFLGSNPVCVIRQASESRAPRLRSLAPSLDRDLETICARCLDRDPKARYESAGDLAADLERWLDGRPIVARPVSAPARIWRWSRRNPKLVGAASAGLLLGAAAVSLLQAEFFRTSRLNGPDKAVAVLPASHTTGTKDDANEITVRPSAQEQSSNRAYNVYLQRLSTDVMHPVNSSAIGVPLQNPIIPSAVANYTSSEDVESRRADSRASAAPPETASSTSLRHGALESNARTKKITADAIAAAPDVPLNSSVRERGSATGARANKIARDVNRSPSGTAFASGDHHRALEAGSRTSKVTAEPTPAVSTTAVTATERRASEVGVRTNKITTNGPASIQGFAKYGEGQPIKDADVRIESGDGKQVFSTVKTDPNGRYVSRGLQPGVYRVTLLVNRELKASIMSAQTKANQPTQLNFDLKQTPQAGNAVKGGKHMVWMPSRTGSHIGGNWVEVDDRGKAHSGSNIDRMTLRRW